MTKKLKYLFVCIATLFISSTQAQTTIEEYIKACPEMEVGKLYTGKDVRAVKKYYKGAYIFKHQLVEQFPFAKITKGDYVHVLIFDNEFDGALIHLHVYTYNKNYQKISSSNYVYSDGEEFSGVIHRATIELTEKDKIIINQAKGGTYKQHSYQVKKKSFEYSSK